MTHLRRNDIVYSRGGMNIKDMIGCAEKLERENLTTYDVYFHVTTHMGLKKLLQSILQEEKDHVKKFDELLRDSSELGKRFASAPEGVFDYSVCDEPLAFDALVEYTAFLRMIIERERRLATVYELLSGLAYQESDRFLFRSLADDEKRHVAWAQDRLDLEVMLSS